MTSTLKNLSKCSGCYMQYETDDVLTWCSGCGNYAIQNALKRALALENIDRRDWVYAFDVGCSGNGSDKIETTTIHGLHGRVLPLAAGIKIGNQNLKVVASAGDGATFSEGVGHLVHAVRNDYPVMFLHHDNQNYGLTTGQASALTPKGSKMNSSPDGVNLESLNPLEMVLSLKPSFVARTSSIDTDHMTEIFREGLRHTGFAFIEILQDCPTYNKATPHQWYVEHTKDIGTLDNYDPTDIWAARKVVETMDPIYLGVLFRDETREDFLTTVEHRKGVTTPLVDEVKHVDVSAFLASV